VPSGPNTAMNDGRASSAAAATSSVSTEQIPSSA
jgi:hypothetical protein